MSWIEDIKSQVYRRIPDLKDNELLCSDLIDDSFMAIMLYSKANKYNKEWDKILVRCVAMLYNTIGVEGSVYRSSISTIDTYESTDIIAPFIQANIVQSIKPVGYKYPDTRFDYPE